MFSFLRQSLYKILLKTLYDVLQFYRELKRAYKPEHFQDKINYITYTYSFISRNV